MEATLVTVNASRTIISIRSKLQMRHILLWMLLFLPAAGYLLSVGWLISFFSHAGAIAFLAAGAVVMLYTAWRRRCFRRYTLLDAARYLDDLLQSKDRFVSFIELAPVDEPGKLEFLGSQLDHLLESCTDDISPRFELPRYFFPFLFGLAVPLTGALVLFGRQSLEPEINENQIALIESVMKNKDALPPELVEKLEELKDALEEHPLLDAPVADALAQADETLQQSLTSESKAGRAQEKIIDEPTATPAAPGAEPSFPSPTPTPTPPSAQPEQQKKDGSSQKQDQQQSGKQEEKKQDQQSKEGKGKDGKQQNQSQQSQQSSQGNGQGQGNAEGQGQGQQQSGQGSGEKQSESKQENSSAQGKQDGKGKGQSSPENKDSKEGEGQSNAGREGAEKKGDNEGDNKGNEQGEKKDQQQKGDQQGLGDAKKAIDQIKKDIDKEKGKGEEKEKEKGKEQGKEQGKDKDQNPSKGEDGQQGKGEKKSESGRPPQKNGEKDDKDSEKQSGEKGGRSALPAPGETGATPGPGTQQGTEEQERSRATEVNVPPDDEQFDSQYAEKDGEAVQNKKGAVPKTGLADVQLSKPESRGSGEEQYIPPEYESILSGR